MTSPARWTGGLGLQTVLGRRIGTLVWHPRSVSSERGCLVGFMATWAKGLDRFGSRGAAWASWSQGEQGSNPLGVWCMAWVGALAGGAGNLICTLNTKVAIQPDQPKAPVEPSRK